MVMFGSRFLSVIPWGLAYFFFEETAERLWRAEARFFGHIGDGQFGGSQQGHGAVEAVVFNIASERDARMFFEYDTQARFRKT